MVSRRTFLRGVGVSLALPWLESAARGAELAATAARMVCLYVPNGVNIAQWVPETTGKEYRLSPTLAALEAHKNDFSVLSGLGHPSSQGGHSGADTWLTAADLTGTPGFDYRNRISVDQVAAEVIGRQTRFPSLELSSMAGTGSPGHSHTLAFSRNATPLPALSSPRMVFGRLFLEASALSRQAARRRMAEDRSILDAVREQAEALERRLGRRDRDKLDQYLTSIREVERRVARAEAWIDAPKPRVSAQGLDLASVPQDPHDRRTYFQTMYDLIHLALQSDSTRICTFELGREADGGTFGELGVKAGHHELSHHGGDADMLAQLQKIDIFYLQQLGRFLDRLQATPDGDGNLLNRTMVLYGSGMNSGAGGEHSPKNLPLLFAGGRALGIQLGRHLAFSNNKTPLANVLLTMLQKMGVEQERFADSTGSLTGLG